MSISNYLLSITHRRKISKISVVSSFPILLLLVTTSLGEAQVVFGRGPNITNLSPSVPGDNFSLSSGVTCPIPSCNIYGFYGGANDNAGFDGGTDNANPNVFLSSTNALSNSDLDNFGVAAGFNIPIGGSLSKSCKNNARARANLITAKYQSELVKQCFFLQGLQVDFSKPAYREDGPLSALAPCRSIVEARLGEPGKESQEQEATFELPDSIKSEEKVTNIILLPQ